MLVCLLSLGLLGCQKKDDTELMKEFTLNLYETSDQEVESVYAYLDSVQAGEQDYDQNEVYKLLKVTEILTDEYKENYIRTLPFKGIYQLEQSPSIDKIAIFEQEFTPLNTGNSEYTYYKHTTTLEITYADGRVAYGDIEGEIGIDEKKHLIQSYRSLKSLDKELFRSIYEEE